MIRQVILLLLAGLFLPLIAKAQLPDTLHITWHKTTWLVFDAPIRAVDRGAPYVMAQREPENPAMLKVKAGQKGFPESNLTVLTKKGLHAFIVRYSEAPADMLYQASEASLNQKPTKDDTLQAYNKAVRTKAPYLTRGDRCLGAGLYLQGMYVEDSLMFLDLLMVNQSAFDYTIERLRFTEEDRKRSKRTALYEKHHTPVNIYYEQEGHTSAGEWQRIVVVLPAFTLPEKRRLQIRMAEKGGGRSLAITLPARLFKRAKPLITSP
ncbi:DUF4138 domain-containing protein [Roseivirga sp. BDSF3-8]|uniref:DUF4138 domain-containing protein n=1 Tax=Roseivirga sp. BDSF3-8 TaxID=3241598 RepID=UPI00353277D5